MIVLPFAKLFKLSSPRISVGGDSTSSFVNFRFLLLVLLSAPYRLVRFSLFVSLPTLPGLAPRGVTHDPQITDRIRCRLMPTKAIPQ